MFVVSEFKIYYYMQRTESKECTSRIVGVEHEWMLCRYGCLYSLKVTVYCNNYDVCIGYELCLFGMSKNV